MHNQFENSHVSVFRQNWQFYLIEVKSLLSQRPFWTNIWPNFGPINPFCHWCKLKKCYVCTGSGEYSQKHTIWQYGLWSFQIGGTILERFLPKNQHTQRKLLNFENWVSGEVSKNAKSPNLLTFKVNFLYKKLSESFSFFFSSKNINLGAHLLL